MSPTQIIGDGPLDGSGPLGGGLVTGQQHEWSAAGEAGEADGATGVPGGGAKHAKISFELQDDHAGVVHAPLARAPTCFSAATPSTTFM